MSMLVAIIAACEVAFWVVLGLGLLVRYGLRRRGTSAVLLASVPLIDVVLLAVTVLDLGRGATATVAHGLAAVYLGVSVAFGPQIIERADSWAAHRFDGAPRPGRRPRTGRAHANRELRQLGRHALAWAIGCGLLGLAILVVGDAARTEALGRVAGLWTVVLVVDALISVSYTVWPRPTRT
ncbi:MAG: hypothetical protein ABIS86_06285 [Streptosporangiaceae bacterium]